MGTLINVPYFFLFIFLNFGANIAEMLSVIIHHEPFFTSILFKKYSSGIMALALSISTGIKKSDTSVAAIDPKMRATPKPPNIGSVARSNEPKMMATAVNIIGLALVAVAIAMALFFSIPVSAMRDFAKSIRSSDERAEIPMSEMNPISEVAVKKKLTSVIKSENLSATQ